MQTRLAACSCGQLSAEVTGSPVRISICHCLACQRRTGGPFAEQARYLRKDVAITGQSTQYTRHGDEGPGARFHFCPHCDATVFFELLGMGEFVAIPVGAFADPTFPTPTVSVYEERMHQWVVPPSDAEHFG